MIASSSDTEPVSWARSGSGSVDLTSVVERRAELLACARQGALSREQSEELDRLTAQVSEGFNADSDSIRRLHPGQDDELLLRLAELESIHPFADPSDPDEIRSRSEGDRVCFVLENPALPGRPRNVVWVALCDELPADMGQLLSPSRAPITPEQATVAVFYSIWNIEPGLDGIPGGSALLALAMAELGDSYPGIKTFTTLSPIPGFRSWLSDADAPDDADETDRLTKQCARYLCTTDEAGNPIDSVARFHMRNGARLWRLVPRGDLSERGQERSWGVMVNYRYSPEDLAENKLRYSRGELVLGDEVAQLLEAD